MFRIHLGNIPTRLPAVFSTGNALWTDYNAFLILLISAIVGNMIIDFDIISPACVSAVSFGQTPFKNGIYLFLNSRAKIEVEIWFEVKFETQTAKITGTAKSNELLASSISKTIE